MLAFERPFSRCWALGTTEALRRGFNQRHGDAFMAQPTSTDMGSTFAIH